MLMYNFSILYTIPYKIREKTCFDRLRKRKYVRFTGNRETLENQGFSQHNGA